MSPSNEEMCSQKNQKAVKPIPKFLQNRSASVATMAIKPEHAGERNRQRRETDGVGESNEVVEDWDGFGKNEGA